MATKMQATTTRGNQMKSKGLQAVVVLWKIKDVLQITGSGKTNMYGQIHSGDFPAPVQLGSRAVAWRSDAVMAWVESRPVVKW